MINLERLNIMEKVYLKFIFILLIFPEICFSQTTYTWNVTTTGSWTTPTNWTPTRTPAPTDKLRFNGTETPTTNVTNVPTESIAVIEFINIVTATFSTSTTDKILTITGVTGYDFFVEAGSTVIFNSPKIIEGRISSLSGMVVDGELDMYSGVIFVSTAPSGVWSTFNSGSKCVTGPSFLGNPFSGPVEGVMFYGTYIQEGGFSPIVDPDNPVFTFDMDSWYELKTNTLGAFCGNATYGNVKINCPGPVTIKVDTVPKPPLTVWQLYVHEVVDWISIIPIEFGGESHTYIKGDIITDGPPSQYLFIGMEAGNLNLSKPGTQFIGGGVGTGTITFGGFISINVGTIVNLLRNITIKDSSSLNVLGTLNCGNGVVGGLGSFVLPANGTLGIGSPQGITQTEMQGSVQTQQRQYSTQGNYTYNGTSQQHTGNGLPTTVKKLTINNASGVVLDSEITITQQLVFQSGCLIPTEMISMNLQSGTVIGANTSRYIQTPDVPIELVGMQLISVDNIRDYTAPVGTSNRYIPVTIRNSGTVDNILVSAQNIISNMTGLDTSRMWKKQIKLTESVPGGSLLALSFPIYPADCGSFFDIFVEIEIGVLPPGDTTRTIYPATLTGPGPPYTVRTTIGNPITTGGTIVVGNAGYLPVELLSFTYLKSERDVKLSWTTDNEINNSGFDLERKPVTLSGAEGWQKITFVQGNGTTNEPKSYSFTDKKLQTGKYNYRLKQIDYNGSFEYFNLNDDVVIGVPKDFSVSQNYPNPSNPKSKIDFDIPVNAKVTIKLYDVLGREVVTLVDEVKEAGYYTAEFDGTNLASGVYFYKLVSGSFAETKKMVLVK